MRMTAKEFKERIERIKSPKGLLRGPAKNNEEEKIYKITDIQFSTLTHVESNTERPVEKSRVTDLVIQVRYEYKGIDINNQYGVSNLIVENMIDLAYEVDSLDYGPDENPTIISPTLSVNLTPDVIEEITVEVLEQLLEDQIMQEIAYNNLVAQERSLRESLLSAMKSIPGLPTPYSETGFEQLGI